MPSEQRAVPNRRRKPFSLRHFLAAYLALAGAILLVAAFAAYPASGAPDRQSSGDGQTIFQQKCAGCHTIGGGDLVGPDLKDVTARRDTQWLKDFINNPAQMIASDPEAKALFEQYNGATMPAMGLSPEQLDAVVAYLNDPNAAPAAPAAPALPPGAPDPAAGQRLFTGSTSLANGGPACIACHTVGGTGDLGGGALGPDLTHVAGRLGEAGLKASLANIVYPTMAGPFQNRPLTEQELADLTAFFVQADRWQAPVSSAKAGALSANLLLFFGLGLAGTGLLFGLLLFLRGRLKQHSTVQLPARRLAQPETRRRTWKQLD